MTTLVSELNQRGLIHNCSDLNALIDIEEKGGTFSIYCGYDCTAPSLHVGSLLSLATLRRFQDAGHDIVVVLGTATSLIGDPSGKDSARPLLSLESIAENTIGIERSVRSVLCGNNTNADFYLTVLRNGDWLNNLNFIEFLRNIGKHISVNRMLALDSVKTRLEKEEGISFLEFSYSLAQAYDFLHIATMKKEDGTLRFPNLIQLGGSDQFGNIVSGLELIRKLSSVRSFGLTHPLLLNSSGNKMGKTADGAVWLNQEKLSDFDFWQFWRNVEDRDVVGLINKFTDMLIIDDDYKCGINDLKIYLANHVTTLVRGFTAAEMAQQTAIDIFVKGGVGNGCNSLIIREADFGKEWLEIAVRGSLCLSKSDARRLCSQNGLTLNDVVLSSKQVVNKSDFLLGQAILRKGKKNILLVKLQDFSPS